MDKSEPLETKKYAELIISMSTDFLLGKIDEEHYKNVLDMTVNMLLDKPEEPLELPPFDYE